MPLLSTILTAATLLAATSTFVQPPASSPTIPPVTTPQVPTPTVPKTTTTPAKKTTTPVKKAATPLETTPTGPISLESIFTSPGIAALQNDHWVGSEHLYNVAKDLGVVVEIIQPPGQNLAISETAIRDKVMAFLIASGNGLTPRTIMGANQTPLPFLHILLMINPIERGYVAYCAVRLFESVEVERIHLKVDLTWQAITWEKQEMLVAATEQLQPELFKTFETLVTAFTDKLKSYQNQDTLKN